MPPGLGGEYPHRTAGVSLPDVNTEFNTVYYLPSGEVERSKGSARTFDLGPSDAPISTGRANVASASGSDLFWFHTSGIGWILIV